MTTSAHTRPDARVAAALTRYRVLAWITGVWLLALTAVLVAKYGFDVAGTPDFIAVAHGWIYALYLLLTLDLAIKARWRPLPTVGVLLAGTVPFLSFVVERRTTAKVRARQPL